MDDAFWFSHKSFPLMFKRPFMVALFKQSAMDVGVGQTILMGILRGRFSTAVSVVYDFEDLKTKRLNFA